MKKIATFVCAAFAALIMASCSNNSPEGVVKKSMQCLKDKDYKTLVDNCDLNDESLSPEKQEETKKEVVALMEVKVPKLLEKQGDFKSFKILSTEMAEDGNSAVVELEETFEKDGETKTTNEKMKVVKDKDGNWKLKF